jgi:hypothetical protein
MVAMFALFRLLPLKNLVGVQLPAIAFAWVIAEVFYKFHSFTLECAAFLATWFVADAAIQTLVNFLKKPASDEIAR